MFIKLYGNKRVIQPRYECYNIEYDGELPDIIFDILNINRDQNKSSIYRDSDVNTEIEIGHKTSYKTPWCSNMLEILNRLGIFQITRIEKSIIILNTKQYLVTFFDKITMEVYPRDPTINIFTDNGLSKGNSIKIKTVDIEKYNEEMKLGMSESEVAYYKQFMKNPTNIELYDLAQCNSEHSRHTFFTGNIFIDGIKEKSLMSRVKDTINYSNKNSIIAFKDNSSAIQGFVTDILFVDKSISVIDQDKYKYIYKSRKVIAHFTHNAETHNFPTCISPFEGASTGTGGRIRDTIAVGRGGNFLSGIVGYAVGDISVNNIKNYPYKKPVDLLIEASNGCSDYGNKIGEPVTSGFARSFYGNVDETRVEYIKPILYSAGNGVLFNHNIKKNSGKMGNLIVRVGGPAYPIGMGGGAASSRNQSTENNDDDFNAVQRGDPQMENKLCRFVRVCSEKLENNPILSIHDQGSGGMANVTKEIVEPCGAMVSLNNVKKGASDMGPFEIWNAEYQEQCSILIHPRSINTIKEIAKRENVSLEFVGVLTDNPDIYCYDKNEPNLFPIKLDLEKALYKFPKRNIYIHTDTNTVETNTVETIYNWSILNFKESVEKVLTTLEVGSKNFLTHKVDRSVTGLIAQQQCIGPFGLPLSDYSINAIDFDTTRGVVSSIAERPINGLKNIKSMIHITVGEMLSNLIFCPITTLADIKVLTNWMWSIKIENGDIQLIKAVDELSKLLKELEIAVDGGKDSLSMNIEFDGNVVSSPNTLVLKSYVPCLDFTKAITPDFKMKGNSIIFVDFGWGNTRMGGSVLSKVENSYDSPINEYPLFENVILFKKIWVIIQDLIKREVIVSGHDRSDGGLFTTLIEMAISGNFGFEIEIEKCNRIFDSPTVSDIEYFFNEELGLVLEIDIEKIDLFYQIMDANNLKKYITNIGVVVDTPHVSFKYNDKIVFNETLTNLRKIWESTSFEIDKLQSNPETALAEYNGISDSKPYEFFIPKKVVDLLTNDNFRGYLNENFNLPTVGIIREVGSNGDKEMAAAFYQAGFNVIDITMKDMCESEGQILKELNGIAFVGGFSFSDVSGSANGWFSVINSNDKLKREFDSFYHNPKKFALGICNGCQLMVRMGWVGDWELKENTSKIFESRFPSVKIPIKGVNNNIFTDNMNGMTFGIWSAHGEGRFVYKNPKKYPDNIALQYVDNYGIPTDRYPYNPNGSKYGTAAVCSPSGRHFAIMPHPERSFLKWQPPYISNEIKEKLKETKYSPWFILFKNAYNFCIV